MDLRQLEADAAASPPSAPSSPSVGYHTNGNPSVPTPASLPGEWWFHQIAEELRNAIVEASLTPDHTTLTQIRDTLRSLGPELPVEALRYPTIATNDNRVTVTPASATNGGTVSIAAGTRLTVGEEIVSQATGRERMYSTPAYTSADLDVSSTYYIRANVSSGALQIYKQKGTDTDSIPASLKGTPDATSGGGFDSTKFDILLAKVVTSTAGTTPTVTELANAAVLTHSEIVSFTAADQDDWAQSSGTSVTLDWARTPTICEPRLFGFAGESGHPDGTPITAGHTILMVGVRARTTVGFTPDRYATKVIDFVYNDSQGDSGNIGATWYVYA